MNPELQKIKDANALGVYSNKKKHFYTLSAESKETKKQAGLLLSCLKLFFVFIATSFFYGK